jgi:hypothetical protein
MTRSAALYALAAELRSLGLHGRLIARVLGVSSGYLSEVMADLGLAQRHRGANADAVIAGLPHELRQEVMAFRARPKARRAGS